MRVNTFIVLGKTDKNGKECLNILSKRTINCNNKAEIALSPEESILGEIV
jgi:hypothetical protein